ncbi:MAG: HAD family hydrolase [Promethearchaeia archaeon]
MKPSQELIKKLRTHALKCFIFDFDGTLYDIKQPLKDAVAEVMDRYHLRVDKELLLQEIGSVIESIQAHPIPKIILESHDIFEHVTTLNDIRFLKKLKIAAKMFTKYQSNAKESSFFTNVEFLAQKLYDSSELIIVSHNQTAHIEERLEKAKLASYFSEIHGADKLQALKPNPRVFDFFLEKDEEYSPKEIAVIGDMPTDIQAGNKAGFWTIAVQSGITDRDVLERYGPDLILNSLDDLVGIIENGNQLPSKSNLNKAKIKM